MSIFRWGVFGTGAISAKFVAGLAAARDARGAVVVSRTLEKAQRFAAGLAMPEARAGYAEAAREGGVDAVYIATPPAEHVKHALLCIEAGLPVLIEKPMATSAADAQRIADAARASAVFAMEAMWTRFLPAARAMRDMAQTHAIGDIRTVSGSFGSSQVPEPANGIFDPALGGGALTHLAPYPLSLSQWMFGSPSLVHAVGTIGATGVIEDAAFNLRFASGVLGSFTVSIRAWMPDDYQIGGTNGMLGLRGSIVRPHGLSVSREPPLRFRAPTFGRKERLLQNGLVHQIAQRLGRSSRGRGKRLDLRYAGNGYHYQADEVRDCIERGTVESYVMPLDDSIAVATVTEKIRDAIVHRVRAEEDI